MRGGESSPSGLTAPRGEPALHGTGRRARPRYESSDEAQLTGRVHRAYRGQHQDWANEAAEDLEFYNGSHWTDEQIETLLERGQKPVTIQTTYQLVEQALALLTFDDPAFRAVAREDTDVPFADLVANLQQWIWQTSDGNQRFKKACRDYYVRGLGYLYAFVDPNKDYGKGEVMITDLDPFNVIPDPNSTERLFDDASHVLVRRVMTGEQIRSRWPEAPIEDLPTYSGTKYNVGRARRGGYDMQLMGEANDMIHDKYEVIERFTKVDRPHWRVRDPSTGREQVMAKERYRQFRQRSAYIVDGQRGMRPVIDQRTVRALDELHDSIGPVFHYQRQPGQVVGNRRFEGSPEPVPGEAEGDPRAVPGSTQRLTPTTAGRLVDENMIEARRFIMPRVRVTASVEDYLLYEPIELPISEYPVVPFANTHNRNPYPISDVRRVKHLQEVINKTNSLILAHASNTTNQKVFYPRGGIGDPDAMEEQWSRAGSAFIPYDPAYGQNGGINVAAPGQLPAELYQNQDRFIRMMERTLGIFSMQQGDPSQAPDTYQGTLSIDEFGMRRIRSKMDDLEHSVERVGNVATKLAQHLYAPQKVRRIAGPSGETIEEKLGVPGAQQQGVDLSIEEWNEITSTDYDLIVDAGSTLPSNRWAQLQQYIEMYDRGLVDDIAVLKSSELPDADEILKRKSVYQQLQGAVQQQRETIENLKSEVQTAQRAAIRGEKKAELAKFTQKLDSMQGEMDKALEVFQNSLQNEQEKQRAVLNEQRQRMQDKIESSTQTE